VKFKILPKVHGFTDANGAPHLPGEIVDLPESYKGETWLEPVEKEPEVKAPPAKVEPVAAEEKPVPFENPKKVRKAK